MRRRHVYHLAGYDPIDADAQYRRFARQLEVLKSTWGVDSVLSDSERSNDYPSARWTVKASAAGWQVDACYELLLWDDIVRADFTRSLPARLLAAARAYFDFIVTGTVVRYVIANQRYAAFFLFPILSLALFVAGAWIFAHLLMQLLGLTGIGAAVVGLLVGLAVFLALLRWPGRRWRVQQLLDDWIFARDYLLGRRPDVDARLDRFAEALIARSREAAVDEIVL